ncbi:MAG: DUF1697 domain-containing protein [Flavobacteriales bacterium]|nr:DUF1697 domain-containing protein [Flavobacteriales bacterium]
METYIAMLRGINVSGQKKIKMADLRGYMEELSFQDVETYIQSGNIVFKAKGNATQLAQVIRAKILERYGFEVPTLVKQHKDFEYVLANCPFMLDPAKDESRFYITFLDCEPETALVEKLEELNYSPEEYVLDGTNIFFYSPNGYGNAKMNNNFFEKKLKVSATTRNWKTVHKLAEMSSPSS